MLFRSDKAAYGDQFKNVPLCIFWFLQNILKICKKHVKFILKKDILYAGFQFNYINLLARADAILKILNGKGGWMIPHLKGRSTTFSEIPIRDFYC